MCYSLEFVRHSIDSKDFVIMINLALSLSLRNPSDELYFVSFDHVLQCSDYFSFYC